MVEATRDVTLKALRSVVRVALTKEVLRVDARDKACVAGDALIANLVLWSIHPRHRRLAHVASRGLLLPTFNRAIN